MAAAGSRTTSWIGSVAVSGAGFATSVLRTTPLKSLTLDNRRGRRALARRVVLARPSDGHLE